MLVQWECSWGPITILGDNKELGAMLVQMYIPAEAEVQALDP